MTKKILGYQEGNQILVSVKSLCVTGNDDAGRSPSNEDEKHFMLGCAVDRC